MNNLERKLLKEQIRAEKLRNREAQMAMPLKNMANLLDLQRLPERLKLQLLGEKTKIDQDAANTDALNAQRLTTLINIISGTHDVTPMAEQVQRMIDPVAGMNQPKLQRLNNPLSPGTDPEEEAKKQAQIDDLRKRISKQKLRERFGLEL